MFGERLREFRILRGISQEELGKRFGVSKQTVSNWENENATPSLDMFQNLVDFFHTTPNRMLGYESYVGLDVTDLTEKEIQHIVMLIDDLKAHHKAAE
ncbi:MAG: helix-turn-helix transcriptional regulator [Clostridia bacterium]|nr:helix-turn-helix transcriptional regulator [Clostridia bacterium]MBQ7051981.1 helix-turn-helix transcriptional regulator [Clostridia bacterium]